MTTYVCAVREDDEHLFATSSLAALAFTEVHQQRSRRQNNELSTRDLVRLRLEKSSIEGGKSTSELVGCACDVI